MRRQWFPDLSSSRLVVATAVLTAGLALVGWLDYHATRRDLLTLLVEQAASLRQAVAAAAKSADAASMQARASLTARLLDNARLLDRLDAARALDQRTLDAVASQHRLFRVTIFSETGARQMTAGLGGPPQGAGRGFGQGPGGGPGPGAGGGFGTSLAERLLSGTETEAVSELHGSRWSRGWRLAAGVRRARGGAIVLNVDAADLADLQQAASLDRLLEDIAAGAPEVAYIVLGDGQSQSAHGRLVAAAAAPGVDRADRAPLPLAQNVSGLTAYEIDVAGSPVLEFAGPIDPAAGERPTLRLGLSLDGLRSAERRSLTRLVLSLLAALGLGLLAVAFVGLRREHGALQARHERAQEALRRRDRLAAMGELASTVAHEIRNPLNAVGMSVQRLRREFLEQPAGAAAPDTRAEQGELLDVLSSETRRINRIIQQFLDFARPPKLAPMEVNLAALVRDTASAAQAFAEARGVTVDVATPEQAPAQVDPDQFRQALANLLRNAVEASPHGSTVRARVERAGGNGPRIVIEDSGPGIAPDHLPRIFDLYFTTKTDGTGVGLAVTHQIVEAHGGTIEVDTALGRGTRMTVTLPPADGSPAHV